MRDCGWIGLEWLRLLRFYDGAEQRVEWLIERVLVGMIDKIEQAVKVIRVCWQLSCCKATDYYTAIRVVVTQRNDLRDVVGLDVLHNLCVSRQDAGVGIVSWLNHSMDDFHVFSVCFSAVQFNANSV